MLFGLHEVMALAEQPDVPDGGFASESNLEVVVELEPVRRAAQPSVSHRPGTARLVSLPDSALDGGGDVAVVHAGNIRLRARTVGQRLAPAIALEDQLVGVAHALLE